MASEYGTGNLNPTNVHAVKELLAVIGAQAASDPFIKTVPVAKNKNETVMLNRAVVPDANIVPAAEGITPAPRNLTLEPVQGTFEEFVEIYGFTSRQTELGEFDVVGAAKDVLAELMAAIREEYRWSIWKAGDNVLFNAASITAQTDVNGAITLGRLDKAIRILDNNKAKKITKAAKGALQSGTVPMPPAYIAFCHTDLLSDLRALPGWREAVEVGGLKEASPYHAGSVRNVAFVVCPHYRPTPDVGAAIGSTNMKSTTGVDIDAYQILIFGVDALGAVSLKGMESKGGYGGVKIEVLDKADKSDPANQRTYVASRHWDNPLILCEHHVVRVEVGCTDNPA